MAEDAPGDAVGEVVMWVGKKHRSLPLVKEKNGGFASSGEFFLDVFGFELTKFRVFSFFLELFLLCSLFLFLHFFSICSIRFPGVLTEIQINLC